MEMGVVWKGGEAANLVMMRDAYSNSIKGSNLNINHLSRSQIHDLVVVTNTMGSLGNALPSVLVGCGVEKVRIKGYLECIVGYIAGDEVPGIAVEI